MTPLFTPAHPVPSRSTETPLAPSVPRGAGGGLDCDVFVPAGNVTRPAGSSPAADPTLTPAAGEVESLRRQRDSAPLCPAGHLPHTGGDRPAATGLDLPDAAAFLLSLVAAHDGRSPADVVARLIVAEAEAIGLAALVDQSARALGPAHGKNPEKDCHE